MDQDAITLLEADHQRVEALFRDYQAARGDPAHKMDLAQIICMELTVHAMLEEELFYPAFRRAAGEDALVDEARREHEEARELIARIPSGGDPDPLMARLQRAVEHHVAEERLRIFPRAQRVGMELEALAKQLEARRSRIVATLQEG